MAKKKDVEQFVEEVTTKTHIKAEDYWRWRTSISEMQKADLNLKNSELQHKLLQKDAEMVAVRAQLFHKSNIGQAKEAQAQLKKEYEVIKAELEAYLGYSLNGKAIDDFTYEVRDLPQTHNEKES